MSGVHSRLLADKGLVAVSRIKYAVAPDENTPPEYKQAPAASLVCDNVAAPATVTGLRAMMATHTHHLVASRGRVWEALLDDNGREVLAELPQKPEQRARQGSQAEFIRRVTIQCPFGDAHVVFIPINRVPALGPTKANPNLSHTMPPRLERGEYLRIFAEEEDAFQAAYVNRPAAENENSALDRSLPWKRHPAYGVFNQTLYLLGRFNGRNILNNAYVRGEASHAGSIVDIAGHEHRVQSGVLVFQDRIYSRHPDIVGLRRLLMTHRPSRRSRNRRRP